jgi:hypothetical protein
MGNNDRNQTIREIENEVKLKNIQNWYN